MDSRCFSDLNVLFLLAAPFMSVTRVIRDAFDDKRTHTSRVVASRIGTNGKGALVPTVHCLSATAFMSIVAKHVQHLMTTRQVLPAWDKWPQPGKSKMFLINCLVSD